MSKKKWLRWTLGLIVLMFVASAGFSRALRTDSARRYLTAHLVASFGRPVDVSRFDFSLLDGARLEAHSVTVAEDPHFGNEYFLRADTLTAGLRWTALLSGRFEFGSLTLLRPSLNLVRDDEGHWNIERWLPPAPNAVSRPRFVGPLPASRGIQAARLYRIQVEGGRINFKQRDDKSPFALRDVSGRLEQDAAGHWRLDLESRPMRAGVELQDIGLLRLRGTIGGTSARLQPAELNLTWRAASLADGLRLARQVDYGMRGEFSVDLNARVTPPGPASVADSTAAQWTISGTARFTGVHSWKLPGHQKSDPSLNVSVEAGWRLGKRQAEIEKFLVEMASSHVQGRADLDWGHGFNPQLHVESSTVGLSDVLSWYRALRPGVPEDLRADGVVGVDVTLGGWPMQLQHGAIASSGGMLSAAALPTPLQIGELNASVSRGGLDFAPTEISFSPASSSAPEEADADTTASPSMFRLRGSVFPDANSIQHWPWNWNFSVEGATPRAQDWLTLSETLAQPLNDGWTAAGGLAAKMSGNYHTNSPSATWQGTMDSRGLSVSPAQVNQSVRLPKAHAEFGPAQRTITLIEAGALGAVWHGTIQRKTADKQWAFDLSADRIDVADLDRWLGLRARPGFLARFASLGSAVARPPIDSIVTQMEARGHLHIGEIVLAPLRCEQVDAEAELSGRTITIRKAQADFFGGRVAGTLDAKLLADPSYEFVGRFDRVNLLALGHSVPFINGRIIGTASAVLSLSAHGIGRENLVGSLQGGGTLTARNVEAPGVDLKAVFPSDTAYGSLDQLMTAQAEFRIRDQGIDLRNLVLDRPRGRIQAEGRIDFSHTLNVRVQPSNLQTSVSPAPPSAQIFLLTGTIEAPKLGISTPVAKPRVGMGGR